MRTTSRHFKVFKAEADALIKRLGLTDWRVEFRHEDYQQDARATFQYVQCDEMPSARLAVISLQKDWDIAPTDRELKFHAWHEVYHQLIIRLSGLGKCRYVSEREIDEEEHSIIQRLLNAHFKPLT